MLVFWVIFSENFFKNGLIKVEKMKYFFYVRILLLFLVLYIMRFWIIIWKLILWVFNFIVLILLRVIGNVCDFFGSFGVNNMLIVFIN